MNKGKLLVVDDEPLAVEATARYLNSSGYITFTAENGEVALAKIADNPPDVVLLDIRMPRMSGLECLRAIKSRFSSVEVIMATALEDLKLSVECMQAGAFGYMTKPLDMLLVLENVNKALEHKKIAAELKNYQLHLEDMVEHRTRENQLLMKRLKGSFLSTIEMMIGLLEFYDPFLGGHSRRVGYLSGELARTLRLPENEITECRMGGLLHDVGTIALPPRLRSAPFSQLGMEEIALIKQHPLYAEDILSHSDELKRVGPVVRSHLEKLDGSGFPDGLHGSEINIAAKVVGASNAYDELVNRRRFTQEEFATQREKDVFAFGHLRALKACYQANIVDALEVTVKRIESGVKGVLKVPLGAAMPGMVLAVDLFGKDGMLILAKGQALRQMQLQRLQSYCSLALIEPYLFVEER